MTKKKTRATRFARHLCWALLPTVTAVHAAQDEATTELPTVQVSADKENTKEASREGSADSGYRVRTATVGPLGNMALADTPYSVSVTSSEFIDNLHANRPTEALRYNPAVNPEMGSNRNGDYFAIRGFINSSNQAIDGMRASVAAGGWLEDKERIEVFSGASGFLYGLASPAGMINYVLKRPTATAFHSLTVGDYGGAQAFAHLDMGGPLDQEGRFGYRLNVVGVNDGNTGVDRESQERSLFSAAIDWHLTDDTLLSFDAARYHSKLENLQAYFFVSAATGVPDAPDASRNYSAPYSIAEQDYQTQGVSLQSKLNEHVNIRGGLRFGEIDSRYQGLRDRFVTSSGNYTQEMYYYKAPNVTTESRGNLFADISFATGPLEHVLTTGVVSSWVTTRSGGTATYSFGGTVFNLADPQYQANPNLNTTGPSFATEKTRQTSYLLADQIRFDQHWSMLVGGNYATINDATFSSSTGKLSGTYDKQEVTPSVALMYKPVETATLYGSYIEALEQGATAPSTAANAGEVLAPYVSNQYEVGAKVTLGQTDLKAALFRIEKASAYTDPVSNVFADDGRQVHKGAEFSFTGKVSDRLTLLGGISVLDAKLTKTAGGAMDGKTPQAVPETQSRLYGEYALAEVPGLVLAAGISHTGAMWADSANTLRLPAYTTGDLGLRYTTTVQGHKTTYRANISNVTDKHYWTTKGGSMIYLGSPRLLAASATFEF
jgi:iron complex outermembrane recepter protein